jgi:crotonobetainyl-CoA:carnitine CoA-transferase CaiB-like acyl-CoA transferase
MAAGVMPCADGYMEWSSALLRRDRFGDMIGNPDWYQDPRWADPASAADPALVEEFNAYFLGWCIERTKREIWAEARRAKVLCAPLFTMEDLFADNHFRDRGFWTQVDHPVMGTVTIPGRPFIMQSGGWELRRPAPMLGEHTREVLKEAGLHDAAVAEVVGGGA